MILTTARVEPGAGAQRYEAVGDAFTIGRGADCDWVLPDPGRLLSKRHCRMALQRGLWLLTDLSSNGMTINGRPVTPGVPQPVQDGDRLGLGAYEIDVALAGESEPTLTGQAVAESGSPFQAEGGRLVGDPFAAPGAEIITDPFDVALPSAFSTADRPVPQPGAAGTMDGYHVSDLKTPFEPPRPTHLLLPEDWDAPERPEPRPSEPFASTGFPIEPPPALPAAAAPVAGPAAPGPVAGSRQPAPREDGASGSGALEAFAAFARGAGLDGMPREAPEVVLEQLGRAFRAYVVGLRRLMIARATIKGEFRIERTMIRPFGNNPLKFSADDDDAVAALLGIGRQVGMSAEEAVADSLRDVRLHEMAITRGLDQGIRQLVAELSPARVTDELPPRATDALPVVRDSRAWAAYVARHAKVEAALADSLDGVFSQAFARAYEAAVAETQAMETRSEEEAWADRPVPSAPGRGS